MYDTFKADRDADLRKLYDEILHTPGINHRYLTSEVIVSMIAQSPAPRYYISDTWARHVVYDYISGNKKMRGTTRQMAEDLNNLYQKLKKQFPLMKAKDLWSKVVSSPAKSFYTSDRTIKEVIFNYTGR